ncbi:MAG: type II toxin-antitoxin system RatA family toxin [Usitatibacter sp.]
MPNVRKSAIVPSSCEAMFALVEDVESYPQFLPWCGGTEVFERTAEITRARLDVAYHGLRTHIATLNRKERPERMTLEFIDGPFERFGGEWRFAPLGGEGCRVELALDYAFSSSTLERLLGGLFGDIADTLVDSFVQRAAALPPAG